MVATPFEQSKGAGCLEGNLTEGAVELGIASAAGASGVIYSMALGLRSGRRLHSEKSEARQISNTIALFRACVNLKRTLGDDGDDAIVVQVNQPIVLAILSSSRATPSACVQTQAVRLATFN